LARPPFDSVMRFELVEAMGSEDDEKQKIGTYGFIKNAPAYIVGAVKESEKNLEDFGYLMECIILYSTGIGLGTCWLGLSFSKGGFSERIKKKDDEIVPAIASVGYTADKQGAVEKILRWGAGSKNRKPWSELFFQNDFTTELTIDASVPYSAPLEMVRLAPSASNKQPWRIVREKQSSNIHFFLERTKNYEKNLDRFRSADLQRIDMGIAMCHFELAARESGLDGKWILAEPRISTIPEDTEYVITWTMN